MESALAGEPGHVQRAALASVLHTFYTGVESVLLTVAKRVDHRVPSGERWHRDLLDQSATATDRRPAVLSEQVRTSLEVYLGFRHFFRQAYTFVLRWDEMRVLVTDSRKTWSLVRNDLERWLLEVEPTS